MMRENFDNDIAELCSKVVLMMDKVSVLLDEVMGALETINHERARNIFRMDDEIDLIMQEVEEKCVELIALQKPSAKDLRVLFSLIKIVTDLERMGDYCVNTAREILIMGQEPLLTEVNYIFRMKEIIQGMIRGARQSFVDDNSYLAVEIGKEDQLVDDLYREIYNEILLRINENRCHISQGTKILFIGRYLERMADHLTNVCEKIVYIHRGVFMEIN